MMVNDVLRKKLMAALSIIILSLVLGGCWDVKHIDELSIVMAIGMDIGKDQEIRVTLQIVNPLEVPTGGKSAGGGGGTSSVVTYTETGKTVLEAVRKIANKTSRRLFFSHNQVLVIGEDIARKGVAPLFEFIERDHEVRTDFYVVVAKGATASDVLQITTTIESIPATKIHDSIDNVEENLGSSYSVTIKDIIEHIHSDKQEIMAAVVRVNGDKKKGDTKQNLESIKPLAVIELNGMAAFKDEKLVGFLNFKQSRGTAWIQDKVKDTVVNVPCTNGNTAIEVLHSFTATKGKFQQGQPFISVHVEQEANIGENLCSKRDVTSQRVIHQLERGTEEQIKKEILAAVKQAQTWKTDIFGFGDDIYKANSAYWKKNKDNWQEIFSKIPVHVKVDTEIRREGIRNKSYDQKVH
jgi:spore germination protein KC